MRQNLSCGHSPLALCLGGIDPSGGAGLYRDLSTLAALGIEGMAISTAETVQNGAACLGIYPPAVDPLVRLDALAGHLRFSWGVKLGLCAMDDASLNALLGRVRALSPLCQIWDPILAPTAGVGLHDAKALARLGEVVLRQENWVVCPNVIEAQALLGAKTSDPVLLARPWLEMGARAVWLKGGHGKGESVEDFWLVNPRGQGDAGSSCGSQPPLSLGKFSRLAGERRGTGCTVATAWLALKLLGQDDESAARGAVKWLRQSWDDAWMPGHYGRAAFRMGKQC